jgi:hypothetical protein
MGTREYSIFAGWRGAAWINSVERSRRTAVLIEHGDTNLPAGNARGMVAADVRRARRMANKTPAQQAYLVILTVVAWLAVGLQIWLVMQTYAASGGSAFGAVLHTLSYFTVLTNLVVAVVTTASATASMVTCELDSFLTRPGTMTAVAVYIFVVGLVYSLFLRSVWDPTGLNKMADVALHDAVPLLYVMYWLIFVPKKNLNWTQPFYWLIYPLAYFLYALVRGEITGKYPYWFADPTVLGYPRTFANSTVLLIGFLVLGEVAVSVGRLRGSQEERNA